MRNLPASILLVLAIALFGSVSARAQVWTPPPPPGDAPADLKAGVQQADALYTTRDQGGHETQTLALLRDLGAKYPASYAVQWRLARILFWVSESKQDKDEHRKLAEEGWEAGKKAIAANPNGPEGLYFKAICVGEVAHSVGILTALRKGLEGEFRDPLLQAVKLNPNTDNGGIYRALGRYKFELPWPKRDLDQSEKYLRQAMAIRPADLRARVYLADTLQKRDNDGDADRAKQLLKEIYDAPLSSTDAPEDRRAKQWAHQAAARFGWNIQ